MSFEVTRSTVASYFFDEWDQSVLPVIPENKPAPVQTGAWGRFSILQGATEPMEIGRASVRGVGFAVLQVFVPEAGGSKTFTDVADEFADIFDLLRLSSPPTYIVFGTASIVEAGTTKGWIQKNIRVDFRRDTHA